MKKTKFIFAIAAIVGFNSYAAYTYFSSENTFLLSDVEYLAHGENWGYNTTPGVNVRNIDTSAGSPQDKYETTTTITSYESAAGGIGGGANGSVGIGPWSVGANASGNYSNTNTTKIEREIKTIFYHCRGTIPDGCQETVIVMG